MFLNKPFLSSPGNKNSLPLPNIFLKVPPLPKNLPEVPFKPCNPLPPAPEPKNFDPNPAVAPANKASLVDKPEALPTPAVNNALPNGCIPGIKLTAIGATFLTTFLTFLNSFFIKNSCSPVLGFIEGLPPTIY